MTATPFFAASRLQTSKLERCPIPKLLAGAKYLRHCGGSLNPLWARLAALYETAGRRRRW